MREIILYGNDCPKCRIIKSKLEKENIKFIESSNENDVEVLKSLGFKSYPVLKVDEEYKEFASAYKWISDRSFKNEN